MIKRVDVTEIRPKKEGEGGHLTFFFFSFFHLIFLSGIFDEFKKKNNKTLMKIRSKISADAF